MTSATTTVPLHGDPSLACRRPGVNPEVFFPPPGAGGQIMADEAKKICRDCPRRADCLQWALATGDDFGIAGGYTPNERRHMVRNAQARIAPRPQRPAREKRRWGWQAASRVDPVVQQNTMDAARHYLTTNDVDATVARFGVARSALLEATAVARWAPELVDDVLEGWVSFAAAYRYAQDVRRWTTANGAGA